MPGRAWPGVRHGAAVAACARPRPRPAAPHSPQCPQCFCETRPSKARATCYSVTLTETRSYFCFCCRNHNHILIEMMEKPKRPMSAYLLWLNSERGKIKADHPGLKVTEVAKKAGELWRSMDDKSTWEGKAAVAKEQYARDLECFNANGGAPPAKKAAKRGAARGKPVSRSKVKREAEDDEDAERDSE